MRLRFAPVIVIALSAPLAGCGGGAFGGGFDPTDLLSFLDTKKPLPGDRRPVFPEGVPGVERGVPPDMVRGSPGAVAAREQAEQARQPQLAPQPQQPPAQNQAAVEPAAEQAAAPRNIAPPSSPRPKGPPAKRRSITAPEEAPPAQQQQTSVSNRRSSSRPSLRRSRRLSRSRCRAGPSRGSRASLRIDLPQRLVNARIPQM